VQVFPALIDDEFRKLLVKTNTELIEETAESARENIMTDELQSELQNESEGVVKEKLREIKKSKWKEEK
jgi:hypothetical protein